MLNIREIARLAKISPTAVSLALRGRPGVSASTRARVIEIAERHGYSPNPLVTALMSEIGRGHRPHLQSIIGVITPRSMLDYEHSTPHLFFEGLVNEAEKLGFLIEQFCLDELGEAAPLTRMLHARRVAGVVLHDIKTGVANLQIDPSRFAFVSIGTPWEEPFSVDMVSNDHAHTVSLALSNLHRLGYRRIGLSLDQNNAPPVEWKKMDTYLGWQSRAHNRAIPPFRGPDWGRAAFLRWFEKNKPDAIICSSLSQRDWLISAGRRIPEDVAYAHLDIDAGWTGTAGANQHNELVGATVIDHLAILLNANRFGTPAYPRTIKIRGSWVDGDTAPPRHPVREAPRGTLARETATL